MTDPSTGERAIRTRVLLLLLFAYIFNFIDRNIIGVLAVPIREEFGLSDTALSTLGVAFGVFYATIAIPIAWAADRQGRVGIIAGAVALWSLFTAACGVVQSYTQLVIARMGVAVGEAAGLLHLIRSSPTIFRARRGHGRSPSIRSAFQSARRWGYSSVVGWPRICRGATPS